MALKFLEGFEQYQTGVDLTTLMPQMRANDGYGWTYVSNTVGVRIVTSPARTVQTSGNGKALHLNMGNLAACMSLPSLTDLILGAAVYPAGPDACRIFSICRETGLSPSTGIRIVRNSDHSLSCIRNSDSVTLGTSAASVLSTASWSYIEVRVKLSATVGEVEVRVNGNSTPVLNLSGVNTAGGASSYTVLSLMSSNPFTNYFDDLYVCDTTGTVNNTFLGPISVYTLRPSGDASVQYNPTGAASNWDCVNDDFPDNDTTYVSTSTTGAIDYYQLDNLPISPTSIPGVIVQGRTKMSDPGARSLKLRAKVSATSAAGAAKTLTQGNYTTDFSVFEKQPDGTSAWDTTSVNSLEAGYESS